MTAIVLHGDAAALPLPDASVDLIVTSPPYWALRSYRDGGEHYTGQIGAEPTPAQYVDSLITCTREWMRVLKPTGSLWVNLGDKYSGSPSGPRKLNEDGWERDRSYSLTRQPPRRQSVPAKSLIGLPWRYALRCIDDLGLTLRAEVVWSKTNGLPESVTDRVRRSHEQWFHFTQQLRYFAAIDAIRQPHSDAHPGKYATDARGLSPHGGLTGSQRYIQPLGALPGSVWSLPSEPLKVPPGLGVDHFAAFPTALPLRIVAGWSPSGICTACGEGRRPVAEASGMTSRERLREAGGTARHIGAGRQGLDFKGGHNVWRRFTLIGEACGCAEPDAPTVRAVVLDPFGGTGTTALVASVLGRVGISVDKSLDYCRLAAWRTNDPKQRDKVATKACAAVQTAPPTTPDSLEVV